MGMYTALHFAAELQLSTPDRVIRILRYMVNTSGDKALLGDDPTDLHELFKHHRWHYMLACGSYYHNAATHSEVIEYPTVGYGLSVTCDFKNYEGELDLFLDWIMPYVEAEPGEWLGYHRYEEDEAPTLIFYPGGDS